MTQETMKKVDEFLVAHGRDITELKTDKEKVEELWYVATNAGANKDCEISYFQNKDKSILTAEELERLKNSHIEAIHNFELVELNAKRYIGQINFERKEERKLARKQVLLKVLSIFKGKK